MVIKMKRGRGRPTNKTCLNKDYHSYSPEQEEFIMAAHKKRLELGVKYPPIHFYFDVLMELGYKKP